MAPFVYTKLASPKVEIRLFELIPGPGRLRGILTHFELDSVQGKYDALSYCWGEQKRRVSIVVNDRTFYISKNLHAALKSIRHQHEAEGARLIMWIDALCINQDDTAEKNAQVPMMREIYFNGRQTYVWLGPHNVWTPLGFKEIKMRAAWERERENRDSQQSEVGWWRWRQIHASLSEQDADTWDDKKYGGLLTHLISKTPLPVWLAASSVLGRPWFSRSWVVQEMATSKSITMVCGKYHIDWGDMEMAFKGAPSKPGSTSIEILISIRQSFHSADSSRLETLLWSTNTFQTTDPRDRIFSLFGLVSPEVEETASDSSRNRGVRDGIRIDYGASIRDVYIETTVQCLSRTGHVGILAVCLGTRKTKLGEDFPSWVLNPDPSRSDPPANMSFAWALPTSGDTQAKKGGWKASGMSSKCEPELDKENSLLGLKGIIIDTVEQVGIEREGFPSPGGFQEIMEHAKTGAGNIKCYFQWRALSGVGPGKFYRGTTKTADQAFLEIMCPRMPTANDDDAAEDEKHWMLARQFDKFVTSTFKFMEGRATKGERVGKMDAARILGKSVRAIGEARFGKRQDVAQAADFEATDSFSSLRRFLKTRNGYIGLGGTHAKIGDKVVLLAGSPAPFLVRPSTTSGRYKLVCDAYFVQMMAGELWDSEKCDMIWME